MSIELFDQLESKVGLALETIEILRLELEEAREENRRLLTEREQYYNRLSAIVNQLSTVENEKQSYVITE